MKPVCSVQVKGCGDGCYLFLIDQLCTFLFEFCTVHKSKLELENHHLTRAMTTSRDTSKQNLELSLVGRACLLPICIFGTSSPSRLCAYFTGYKSIF